MGRAQQGVQNAGRSSEAADRLVHGGKRVKFGLPREVWPQPKTTGMSNVLIPVAESKFQSLQKKETQKMFRRAELDTFEWLGAMFYDRKFPS